MKMKSFQLLIAVCLASCTTYSQDDQAVQDKTEQSTQKEPHRYGGWYCPDNLNGFPAVDIADWDEVPVVNGRMATREETQKGMSLILVDSEKYPDAKALDMPMPQLAAFKNRHTQRDEIIIVIQAINVDNDSVVGFRYLNGGNGSARLNEVRFLNDDEIAMIPSGRFVSHSIKIKATQDEIWQVLTQPEYAEKLQQTFDKNKDLPVTWRINTNVNFVYPDAGEQTASYGDKLYGCFYVQNDYDHLQYTEKFLLRENEEGNETELIIACGPFADDFNAQQNILGAWAREVKKLSEPAYKLELNKE